MKHHQFLIALSVLAGLWMLTMITPSYGAAIQSNPPNQQNQKDQKNQRATDYVVQKPDPKQQPQNKNAQATKAPTPEQKQTVPNNSNNTGESQGQQQQGSQVHANPSTAFGQLEGMQPGASNQTQGFDGTDPKPNNGSSLKPGGTDFFSSNPDKKDEKQDKDKKGSGEKDKKDTSKDKDNEKQ